MADHQPLDDEADDADHDGGDDQDGDEDVDAEPDGGDGGVAAHHHELAMGEVDHLHHAEDDRQPDADQDQCGDAVEHLQQDDEEQVHGPAVALKL